MESFNIKNRFEDNDISIYQAADLLRGKNKTTKDLVIAVGKFIIRHARTLSEPYQPKSILESRFTPAEEAFSKGMKSCGAIANISAEMLRHVGLEVKLVHGECKESFRHAWISVHDPDTDSWIEFDLTRNDGDVPSTHKKIIEIDSWEEIRDKITEEHKLLFSNKSNGGK